ncbi:MAG: hypothetical protein M0R80_28055, partial [Proteobacteria bacterium]|jgi:hypothetical protein|nr:hypothetical protein [Pseudomonadota bacterium]
VGDVHVSASGAAFDLVKNKDGASVYVARGMAVIESSGGRAEVESGERAEVKAGSAPAVAPMGYWEDWTGGMADQEMARWSGSGAGGRLYGIDPSRAAEPPQELQITSQKVRAVIRDGVAHTTVDQRFFNPTGTDLEGWYWFTVPAGAAVERFAWEVDGKLVEGEMIERGRAAATYREAVESRSDPALLEWVDERTFRARVFPVPAAGDRRLILSYVELLPFGDGAYRYVYPMGGERETVIEEFSFEADLGAAGRDLEIAASDAARIENGGTRVSMRRSGFAPRADLLLQMKPALRAVI